MKDRFTKCFGCRFYIREIKLGFFHRWKIERIGFFPVLYERLKGGAYKRIDGLG